MPEGPHLAQLLPAAPKFRLRRVTPSGRALGRLLRRRQWRCGQGLRSLLLAECLRVLCLMAVLSAAGPGWISCDGWTERKRA